MKNLEFKLVIDTKTGKLSLKGVGQEIKGINTGLTKTKSKGIAVNNTFSRLGSIVATAFAADRIKNFADAFTIAESKINLVKGDLENTKNTMDALFRMSNDTRSSFSALIDVYSRTARSSKALGLSKLQLLRVTETLAKASKISGATSQESAAALVQLSQGLASARLGGDELRSVLEQLPRVAEAIAEGIGVSVGELRKLGSEGKLTSEAVIKALLGSSKKIDKEFKTIKSTIADSFTLIENSAIRSLGKINEELKIFDNTAKLITYSSDNLHQVVGLVSGVIGYKLVTAIRAGVTAMKAMTLQSALATGGLNLIVGSLAYLIATNLLDTTKDKVEVAKDKIIEFTESLNKASDASRKFTLNQISKEMADLVTTIEKKEKDLEKYKQPWGPGNIFRPNPNMVREREEEIKKLYSTLHKYQDLIDSNNIKIKPKTEDFKKPIDSSLKDMVKYYETLGVYTADYYEKKARLIEQDLKKNNPSLQKAQIDEVVNHEIAKLKELHKVKIDHSATLNEKLKNIQDQAIKDAESNRLKEINAVVNAEQAKVNAVENSAKEISDIVKVSGVERLAFYTNLNTAIETGYDTFISGLNDTEMTGSQRRMAIWKAFRGVVISSLGDMLKEYIKTKFTEVAVTETTETAKIAATKTGAVSSVATTVASSLEKIAIYLQEAVAGLAASLSWMGPLMPLGVAGTIGSIFAIIKGITSTGFDVGGYTGPGGKYEVAGTVHRGEVVFESEIVRKNLPELMSLRAMLQKGVSLHSLLTPRVDIPQIAIPTIPQHAFSSGGYASSVFPQENIGEMLTDIKNSFIKEVRELKEVVRSSSPRIAVESSGIVENQVVEINSLGQRKRRGLGNESIF